MATPKNSIPELAGDMSQPTTQGGWNPVVRCWSGRRQRAEELKQLHWPQFLLNWRWYRAFTTPFTDPLDWWRSNETIPTAYKIVETILPRQLLGMFDSPDWFNVEARNMRSEEYEEACHQLLRTKVEQMRAFPKFYDCLKYTNIMGHSWGKVYWHEEYQKRQRLTPRQELVGIHPETGEAMMQTTGVDQTIFDEEVFNGPMFDWLPIDRYWPDPSGDGRWGLEEIDTTMERLEETQELLGIYDEAALEALRSETGGASNPGNYGGLDSLADARRGTDAAGVSMEYIREPQATENIPWHLVTPMRDGVGIKLWECWGWMPREARGENPDIAWRRQVIANGRFVLQDTPAPTPDMRPPYFPIKSVTVPKRLYGASILEWIGPIIDQQTRLSNMRLDEVYLGVWQQYLVKKGALVGDNQTLFQPGGYIELNSDQGVPLKETVQVLDRRPVLPDAYQEDSYRQSQVEDAAGATDVMRGVSQAGRQTATEVERMLQQGNARHTLQVMLLEYTFKKEILSRTWEWLRMRLSKAERVKLGEEYVDLDISHIQEPIDIVVGGGLFALSKATRVSMDQELVGLLNLPQFASVSKPDAIFTQLLKDRGWKNVYRFIKSPQEQADEQARAQTMAIMAGVNGQSQPGPGGGPSQGSPSMADMDSLASGGEVPNVQPVGAGAQMAGGPASDSGLASNPVVGG